MIGNIIKSTIFFIIGYISIIVMNALLPPIFTAVNIIFPNTEIEGIMWFGTIIIWIIMTIIYPTYLLTQIEVNPEHKALNTTVAIGLSIFSILLLTKIWYWIPILADLTTDGFVKAIFYAGITIQILMTTIIAPIMIILANKAESV